MAVIAPIGISNPLPIVNAGTFAPVIIPVYPGRIVIPPAPLPFVGSSGTVGTPI